MSTSDYKKRIGQRIRYERMSRNMPIEELAEMLHLSTAFIGLIERGQRGAKISNLIKIADIFNLTVNDLIYDDLPTSNAPTQNPNNELWNKRNNITSLTYDMNNAELDFCIATIRNLKYMRSHDNELPVEDLEQTS